jgi:hypothetical protein
MSPHPTESGSLQETEQKQSDILMNRKEFLRAIAGGVLYMASAPRRDLLIGDSMAYRWKREATDIAAFPGMAVRNIEARCRKFLNTANQQFETVIMFAGTADCGLGPGQSYHEFVMKNYSLSERRKIINTQEKCDQVCADLKSLRNLLVGELRFQKLIVIGPFPMALLDNFQLIECVDGELSKILPEYVMPSRDFFDFTNKRKLDPSLFRDLIHLNKKGYRQLEKLLGPLKLTTNH